MQKGGAYLNYILDQLSDLEGLTFQKTVNGIRFFAKETEFGAIQGGKFKLKSGQACPLRSAKEQQVIIQPNGVPIYTIEVPETTLADRSEMVNWVKKIVEANRKK